MSDAMHTATGTNRVVLGHRRRGGAAADGRRAEGEMAEVEEEGAPGEARNVLMTEAVIVTTTPTVSEVEAGALATNDSSNPAQLQKVVRVDRCSTGDASATTLVSFDTAGCSGRL
jgi:hypothetical protein